MANFIKMIEEDWKPKYDIKELYHYTLHKHLQSILKDGLIMRKAALMGAGTRPAVWMTTNTEREPSVWTRKACVSAFVPIRFKVSWLHLSHRSFDIIPWTEYRDSGGYQHDPFKTPATAELSEAAGRRLARMELLEAQAVGADPLTQWYLCVDRDLSLGLFDPPQVLYRGEWASIDNLEDAIADANSMIL